jgi:hypothetical protein
MVGGQFNNKAQSWAEIVALFPEGSVAIEPHDFSPASQKEWKAHVGAESWWYGDYPGPREQAEHIDISKYLSWFPLLKATGSIRLPGRFVTVQWDAGGASRRVSLASQQQALQGHPEAVVVGGGRSIQDAAYAMSKAQGHVGVDSAFFHLAQLYLHPDQIHLRYRRGAMSHHVRRAIDNNINAIECP